MTTTHPRSRRRHDWGTLLAGLIALTALAAAVLIAISLAPASAETPAERCKRETTAYNNAWKNSWVATHPGKKPSDAPKPPVPYKCGSNDGPPPTVQPTTTAPEAPSDTTAAPTATPDSSGPAVNAPTTRRDIQHPDSDQPSITSKPSPGTQGRSPRDPRQDLRIVIPTGRTGQTIVLSPAGVRAATDRHGDAVSVALAKAPGHSTANLVAQLPAGTRWERAGRSLRLVDSTTGSPQALLMSSYGRSRAGAGRTVPTMRATPTGISISFPSPSTIVQIVGGPIRHPANCPVSCMGPTVIDNDLQVQLLPQAMDLCRIRDIGLSEADIAPLRQTMLAAMRETNRLGGSRDQIVTQGCQSIRPALREIMIRDFPKRLGDTRTPCDNELSPRCQGVVAVCPPKGTGTTYANDVNNYITRSNMNMPVNVRVLTRTTNPRPADDARARRDERLKHPELYPNGSITASHFPDSVWAGAAVYEFGPLPATVNQSIGAQALSYPVGYRNRMFVPGSWSNGTCMPASSPDGGA